ncbi:MAG: RNA 2',3'-cyclic phosphodiesterase [Planifilum fimeticola]
MKPGDLRLFVAVPIPEAVRGQIALRLGELKKAASFRKWVHPRDLHITLQFLGECSPRTCERVKERLGEMAPTLDPFRLKLGDLGLFGNPRSPRILWSGVEGELEALGRLQRAVVGRLSPLGFPAETRPFRPHLTLARNCRQRDFSLRELEALWMDDSVRPEWEVHRIVLYRSHLGRTPMYEPVEVFGLKKDGHG